MPPRRWRTGMYRSIVRRQYRKAWEAMNRHDFEAIITQLAPTFEVTFVGDTSLGGSRHTKDAMRRWFERLFRLFPDARFELRAVAVDGWPCEVSYDLDAVLAKTDVIMMLRVQQERMTAAYFPSVREYSRRYGLDGTRMGLLPEHAIVMHPGPMNRGVEIAAEVADFQWFGNRCWERPSSCCAMAWTI